MFWSLRFNKICVVKDILSKTKDFFFFKYTYVQMHGKEKYNG